jgi:putative transposase
LRIEYAGAFYHVLNRGQRREPIVQDGQDGERFVSDLSKLAQPSGVPIHGYCLMTKDRHRAKDLDRLRHTLQNNE